jgi:hypothetical protein
MLRNGKVIKRRSQHLAVHWCQLTNGLIIQEFRLVLIKRIDRWPDEGSPQLTRM